MTFAYLASPYTHADEGVMEKRFLSALACAAWCLQNRLWVYSPIVHNHQIAERYSLPKNYAFWNAYNFSILDRANELLILAIEGWTTSLGVKGEIDRARFNSTPSFLLFPGGNDTLYHKVKYDDTETNAPRSSSLELRS